MCHLLSDWPTGLVSVVKLSRIRRDLCELLRIHRRLKAHKRSSNGYISICMVLKDTFRMSTVIGRTCRNYLKARLHVFRWQRFVTNCVETHATTSSSRSSSSSSSSSSRVVMVVVEYGDDEVLTWMRELVRHEGEGEMLCVRAVWRDWKGFDNHLVRLQ